jgi:hypothetical protein
VIDFRYHLVSLIAVFLAVALGIIIGTTALNEPILADIKNQVSALEKDKRSLEDRTQQLQSVVNSTDAFADAVAPALVHGTLAGHTVLLVVANKDVPSDTVDHLTSLIASAGGTVSGTLTLQPAYSDPATAPNLKNYVTGSGRPPGVQLPQVDDAGKLVGSLLAQVLMIPPSGRAPDRFAISSVLAGLSALNVLTAQGDSVGPADYAVVLTTGALTGSDAANRNGTLTALVSALDGAGSGAVVAGDGGSAGDNGLVGVIRGNPTLAAHVSTVDNAASAVGRISTVLALVGEGDGTTGKYGTARDTQPVPPVPAATR